MTPSAPLTAGIIGVSWGVVHLYGLREQGVVVDALCATDLDRAREVARQHGVPRATDQLAELEDLDLIVIASPPDVHEAHRRRFPRHFVICEKPACGAPPASSRPPETSSDRVFVNYAFGFLDCARVARDQIRSAGGVRSARIETLVQLPQPFGLERWFLETASHPLAWLLHEVGEARRVGRREGRDELEVELELGSGARVDVCVRRASKPGIRHRVEVATPAGRLGLQGAFEPGAPWRFEPVELDGRVVCEAEAGPGDVWLRANARAVAAMVQVFRGERPADAARRDGLFDVPTALRVERALFGSLGPS